MGSVVVMNSAKISSHFLVSASGGHGTKKIKYMLAPNIPAKTAIIKMKDSGSLPKVTVPLLAAQFGQHFELGVLGGLDVN